MRVVEHDAGGTALAEAALALSGRETSLWALALLLAAFGATAAFGQVVYAHAREVMPPGMSGMAMTGSGGIAAISAGIAEALITTALGLVVAIVAVWAYNYFAGKVEGFNVEMDNSSSELLDYFIKKGA